MKAAYIEAPGPPEAIIYGDLAVPAIGPDEALVKIEAVTVNPVDTYIRAGTYRTALPVPFIIGRDLVGTVERTGPAVTRFASGAPVWSNSMGYDGRQGTFAEYAAVNERRLYPLPAGVDPAAAAAVFHYAATAYTGLVHHAHLKRGEIIFVNGGAGNTGTAVIQVGRWLGARVIATASGADDISWCHRWGADPVIDYQQQDVIAALQQAAPGGVDVNWDTTGHTDLDKAIAVLAERGRIVMMAGLRQRPELPVGPFYTKDASIIGFAISRATCDELSEAAKVINQMLGRGQLAERISTILPLAQAAEAHRLVAGTPNHPPVKGRIVLKP